MIKFSRDTRFLKFSLGPNHHTSWRWGAIHINQGGGPINFTVEWCTPWCWWFLYLYVLGYRGYWIVERKRGISHVS